MRASADTRFAAEENELCVVGRSSSAVARRDIILRISSRLSLPLLLVLVKELSEYFSE